MASPTTSTTLLHAVQECDTEAWGRFLKLYQPLVYSHARRLGCDQEDAADLSQEVLLKIVRGIGGFQRQSRKGGFRNWLRTITRNEMVTRHRRERGAPVAVGGSNANALLQALPAAEQDEEESSHTQREDLEFLRRMLNQVKPLFKPNTWQVFWRTAVDGLTAAEAGEEVGMNAKAVREAKRRVMDRLKKELKDS